ncbi:MAG: hypothetical protein HN657_06950 [Candidatus Marinimicrobia bacterium]|jgi:hypothetical protein|nr:hypothetical protein [Candidatus Neomarinimicrobiota bacterium]MBT3496291.1 hypothetical protein [Candidatus Neomarinimicrobiota bacterium]MBT3691703.1 hypothetical protein [Candidatus Neomarinimicrobiota bacterium]MBT3732816.1 hypothetical protein [Candidatus Neomarinimicrobiota bacterium]MBT4144020.1 hypothetical protein [Candidatus Neomarinimicrobiota bacterium]
MRTNSKIILSLLFLFVGSETLSANYAFKKKIKNVCKSYHVSVDATEFDLGKDTFSMSLESGRNDFEMFMLVGFAAAGQAVAHQEEMGLDNAYVPSKIEISVIVPLSKGESSTFIVACDSDLAISLANGETDSAEFMKIIMKKMITL